MDCGRQRWGKKDGLLPLVPDGEALSALVHPWCGAKYHRAESASAGPCSVFAAV